MANDSKRKKERTPPERTDLESHGPPAKTSDLGNDLGDDNFNKEKPSPSPMPDSRDKREQVISGGNAAMGSPMPDSRDKGEQVISGGNAAMGKASLVCSIVGIVLPAAFGILALVSSRDEVGGDGMVFLAWLVLGAIPGVVLELYALTLGIAARRTTTGKAGMIISGILCFGVVGYLVWAHFLLYWAHFLL